MNHFVTYRLPSKRTAKAVRRIRNLISAFNAADLDNLDTLLKQCGIRFVDAQGNALSQGAVINYILKD